MLFESGRNYPVTCKLYEKVNHIILRTHKIGSLETIEIIKVDRIQGNAMLRWPKSYSPSASVYCPLHNCIHFRRFPSHVNHVAYMAKEETSVPGTHEDVMSTY